MKSKILQKLDLARVYLFSPTRAERRELFDRVIEAGRKFNPLLEDYFDIRLNEVKPRLFLESPFWQTLDRFSAFRRGLRRERMGFGDSALAYGLACPFFIGGVFPFLCLDYFIRENSIFMTSNRNGIVYVSDGIMVRKGLFEERQFKKRFPVEEIVVHEIGHGVWEQLKNNQSLRRLELLKPKSQKAIWEEGFCCYLQKHLMRREYPYDCEKEGLDLGEGYREGLAWVKRTIKQYGLQALKRIPISCTPD